MAAPKAHRTQKCVAGVWYVRLTAGRHKGAAVLGKYQGASVAECDNAIADDRQGIHERYEAAVHSLPTPSPRHLARAHHMRPRLRRMRRGHPHSRGEQVMRGTFKEVSDED